MASGFGEAGGIQGLVEVELGAGGVDEVMEWSVVEIPFPICIFLGHKSG